MAKKIRIFSTPSCPYCKMAKQFLTSVSIPFEDVDVSENEEAANEMIEKSGQMGVPVIDIDGKFVVGFNKSELAKELGLQI